MLIYLEHYQARPEKEKDEEEKKTVHHFWHALEIILHLQRQTAIMVLLQPPQIFRVRLDFLLKGTVTTDLP